MNEVIVTIRKIGEGFMTLADQLESIIPTAESDIALPAEDVEKKEPAPTEKTEPSIKLEKVRAVLADISRTGKTAEMKGLLSKFGASRLSELDPACYEAVLAEAEVIKNA